MERNKIKVYGYGGDVCVIFVYEDLRVVFGMRRWQQCNRMRSAVGQYKCNWMIDNGDELSELDEGSNDNKTHM